MNPHMPRQIDETLDAEEKTYLSGVESGLSEWSSAADEDAYRDLETVPTSKSFSPNT